MLASVQAQSADMEGIAPGCCSKAYKELANEPCDPDHYCNYIDWGEYQRIQVAGIAITIATAAVAVVVVLARDIMKVWTCGGLTEDGAPTMPNRQLTTMSAAYAPETLKAQEQPQPAPSFQNVSVPMGGMPQMQQPMQPMQMQPMMGMPMGFQGQPMYR